MRVINWTSAACAAALAAAACVTPPPDEADDGGTPAAGFLEDGVVFLDQGPEWTPARRRAYYTTDQGSVIMPLAWMEALETRDGAPFLADGLARYGYLPLPPDAGSTLPIGFTVATHDGREAIGMTCAACHTRQITIEGVDHRIDGGPALADFQAFLSDVDASVAAVRADEDAFAAFAGAVLGANARSEDVDGLRDEVDLWAVRYATLMEHALPDEPWGLGRLDAVSMIFNRMNGLNIGEAPTYVIEENIHRADAPVRYPFLWNAARQDRTQWPGFADNGTARLALARNLGQLYGVFGVFHPTDKPGFLTNREYLRTNSANFDGLREVEELIWMIGPPSYPGPVDEALAAEGSAIFARSTADGGCAACHAPTPGERRNTWRTPVLDVGTDAKQCELFARTVKTGTMEGARVRFLAPEPLGAEALSVDVLRTAVVGSILQKTVRLRGRGWDEMDAAPADFALPAELQELEGAFRADVINDIRMMRADGRASGCAYEARVLEGIWAAAPYLHNGSVATLADLLAPAEARAESFAVGPRYDLEAVGLAAAQPGSDHRMVTTGCDALASGNSRCGHEFGVTLSGAEKTALLEYLKTL